MLTGRNIPAQEALQLGLVNAVVPDDQVEGKALEMAKAIAANSPDSIIVLMHGEWLKYQLIEECNAYDLLILFRRHTADT